MKLSYCGLSENQKEFLHNRYISGLEKFYYEKFKTAIMRCFSIITGMCVGISFTGLVFEELGNVEFLASATKRVSFAIGNNLLSICFTLWMLGYMVCTMRNKTIKEFIVDLAKMVGVLASCFVFSRVGGWMLWGLIKLFL